MTKKPLLPNEESTVNLNDYASDLREKARTHLRLINVNNLMSQKQVLVKQWAENQKAAEEYLLNVKRTEYAISKLDKEDPDYDDKKESLENRLKQDKINADDYKKVYLDEAKHLDALKDCDDRIAKWQSGEYKVGNDHLTDLVNTWLKNQTAI